MPIAFGDFRAGYTIAERPDLRILRDPFSAKPHVLFYATKRVGGDVTDFAAIKLLKFAVSLIGQAWPGPGPMGARRGRAASCSPSSSGAGRAPRLAAGRRDDT